MKLKHFFSDSLLTGNLDIFPANHHHIFCHLFSLLFTANNSNVHAKEINDDDNDECSGIVLRQQTEMAFCSTSIVSTINSK